MSRDIKFRIWLPETKELLPWEQVWYSVVGVPQAAVGESGIPWVSFFGAATKMPPERGVVDQYTGFKDREGREIYENDLIELIYSKGHERDDSYDFYGTYLVVMDERFGQWKLRRQPTREHDHDQDLWDGADPVSYDRKCWHQFEIVGNAHQNADLLDS